MTSIFIIFPGKLDEIKSITLIGCGTAYHSCLMAKYWFEELTTLDVILILHQSLGIEKIDLKMILYISLFPNQVKQQILMQL